MWTSNRVTWYFYPAAPMSYVGQHGSTTFAYQEFNHDLVAYRSLLVLRYQRDRVLTGLPNIESRNKCLH